MRLTKLSHLAPSGTSGLPRVAVIGAGCCGLVTIKTLREAGISCQVFELGSDVGGLWDQRHSSGQSAAYDSLRINTSRRAMEFSDFPMTTSEADYPLHDEVAAYLRNYAEHFGLRRDIRFRTRVTRVSPLDAGGYRVETTTEGTGARSEDFDAVIVATGHHTRPNYPDDQAALGFSGVQFHSHDYKSPTVPHDLRGERVVVVGMGNSAMDIASELSTAGAEVMLSYRRGVWVIPRYLLGKPVDQGGLIPHFLPPRLRRRLVTFFFKCLVGRMRDFGLPEPDHLIGEAHPTLSAELPALVRNGEVQMRPALASAQGSRVTFKDGRSEEVSCVIYCTGYRVEFPFLPAEHISVKHNNLPLFLRVFHPEHRHLFFIGLAQPHGAIMPVAEKQARLLASHLLGHYNLPEPAELAQALAQEAARLAKRYVRSKRHTMQLDPEIYARVLRREHARGRRRSRLNSGQPFPPRASNDS